MKITRARGVVGLAYTVSALALLVSAPAYAQEEKPADAAAEVVVNPAEVTPEAPAATAVDITTPEAVVEEVKKEDVIVVTGSRLKRTSYSSISPLQVITREQSQNAGAFDSSQILQRTPVAAGQRIDATFQGFVLDNGPGSETINLRGLDSERTLIMINGRRMAPAGVEGAPTSPSINLIPSILIDTTEILLDGASSVYGSDAVAGVVNLVMRKDFDGLELTAEGDVNPYGRGEDYVLGGSWGMNTDRGFIAFGAEYAHRDAYRFRDRKFLSGCDRYYEETENGDIRTVGLWDDAKAREKNKNIGTSSESCKVGSITGRVWNPITYGGSIYWQGGPGSVIPGYYDNADIFGEPVDANGDGLVDVDFNKVNINGYDQDVEFITKQNRLNLMSFGEHSFGGEGNITAYYEAMYTRARVVSGNTGAGQVFPMVPADNIYNPCNIDTNPKGVDCVMADNVFQGLVGSKYEQESGYSTPLQPIVSVRGDRDNYEVTQEQYRGVFGLKGDLPFIDPSWTFDFAGVYSKAIGKSNNRGLREDKLAFALGVDPTADFNDDGIVDKDGDGIAQDYDGEVLLGGDFGGPAITPCDMSALANPSLAMSDLGQGCVPVNMFATSLLENPIGDFATKAERDYVFGDRRFNTTYVQSTITGYLTGDLFKLPAGNVSLLLGAEWRKDIIRSMPDLIASNGLFFGYTSDKGAVGSKVTKELYGEMDIPLQKGKLLVRELDLNLSGRITNDQYYGTNGTFALKGSWRPIDPLQLKLTYGTSFRAPNLRENFLKGQSGFTSVWDPCAVPEKAYIADDLNGEELRKYHPELDLRESWVLANCRAAGRDPLKVGIFNNRTSSSSGVEATTGASLDINPETSRSITTSMAFEEEFGGALDFKINGSYYDIKLKNSIVEASVQYIVNQCFARKEGIQADYCARLGYDTTKAGAGLINAIRGGFLNLNSESVRGMDFNIYFGKDVTFAKRNIKLGLEMVVDHMIERSTTEVKPDFSVVVNDYAGEWGFPSWQGNVNFTAEVGALEFFWQTRMVGKVDVDPKDRPIFSDVFNSTGVKTKDGDPVFASTCLGKGSSNGNVKGDGVLCRPVSWAPDYFVHTASLSYKKDNLRLTFGVRNLFDTAPPRVDSSYVFAIANTPIGNGYEYDGREFFMVVSNKF